MKEKGLMFLAAFMLVFLSGCSLAGSNEIPTGSPAEIKIPVVDDSAPAVDIEEDDLLDDTGFEMDEDIIEEELVDESEEMGDLLEEDEEIVNGVNSFEAVIDAQKELEGMELEVDDLWIQYDEMFQ